MIETDALSSNGRTLDALAAEAIDLLHEVESNRTQPAAIGVVRNFGSASCDQADRLMQRLRAADINCTEVPLAFPATLREYELQAGPDLVGLLDASATYPLLAAQFASLRRLPMLTVLHPPHASRTTFTAGTLAIALFSAGRAVEEADGQASSRVIRLHNIATRSVVVAPAIIHQHSAVELVSSNLFTLRSEPPPLRKVYDDASFTITASNSGLILTHSSPGFGKRTWTVEEVTLADLGRSHTIKLDSAVPVKTKGSMTLRRIGDDSCDCEHTQH